MTKGIVIKPIVATTETAFQRAILRNGKTILGKKTEIEWLDIELPVDKERGSRGHCVDLIGKKGNRYVICELKFGKDSSTDNPEIAAKQVRSYYEEIQRNWRYLEKQDLHHEDGKMFKWEDLASNQTILCVAANSAYWAYWLGHRKVNLSNITDIEFYSVDIPANLFEKQKAMNNEYTPVIETHEWDIL